MPRRVEAEVSLTWASAAAWCRLSNHNFRPWPEAAKELFPECGAPRGSGTLARWLALVPGSDGAAEGALLSPVRHLALDGTPWTPSPASPTRPRAGTGSSGESGASGLCPCPLPRPAPGSWVSPPREGGGSPVDGSREEAPGSRLPEGSWFEPPSP